MIDPDGLNFYVRPLATIEPTAIRTQLPVNTQYGYLETDELAAELISPKYRKATVFVAWEHIYAFFLTKQILRLLKATNIDVPIWPSADFDSLYVITINWDGKSNQVNFSHQQQHLDNQNKNCFHTEKFFLRREDDDDVIQYVFVPDSERDDKINQLTCQGLNRALFLSQFFRNHYAEIDAFIMPEIDDGNNYQFYLTALMTLEPTVIHFETNFVSLREKSERLLLRKLNQLRATKNVIVISWPAEHIATIAQEFFKMHGGDSRIIPNPIPNRDTIYEISLLENQDKEYVFFRERQENLNDQPKDCLTDLIPKKYANLK